MLRDHRGDGAGIRALLRCRRRSQSPASRLPTAVARPNVVARRRRRRGLRKKKRRRRILREEAPYSAARRDNSIVRAYHRAPTGRPGRHPRTLPPPRHSR